jgi:hypothetical protein
MPRAKTKTILQRATQNPPNALFMGMLEKHTGIIALHLQRPLPISHEEILHGASAGGFACQLRFFCQE